MSTPVFNKGAIRALNFSRKMTKPRWTTLRPTATAAAKSGLSTTAAIQTTKSLEELMETIETTPNEFKTLLITIAAIEIIVAIIGNILLISSLRNKKGFPGNSVKRDLISVLVGLLAVDDILMALINVSMIVMSAFNESEWHYGEFLCKYREPVIMALVGVSCTLMMVIASVRYHRITRNSVIVRRMSSTTEAKSLTSAATVIAKACGIVLAIMVAHALLSIPAVIHGDLHQAKIVLPIFGKFGKFQMREYVVGSYCVQNWSDPSYYIVYTCSVFLLSFIFPLVVTFVIHLRVITYISGNAPQMRQGRKYINKSTRLLVAVLITFAICWSPYQFLALIINVKASGLFTEPSPPHFLSNPTLIHGLKLLTVAQACVNPILYGFYNREARHKIHSSLRRMSTFRCYFKRQMYAVHRDRRGTPTPPNTREITSNESKADELNESKNDESVLFFNSS